MMPVFWNGKRVLVTGHTGFKGGWLCLWLRSLGADVHGFALPPPTEPNLFTVAGVIDAMTSSTIADIRDYDLLLELFKRVQPEIVLHLAAQPLVGRSYHSPIETYGVNVMGTAHVLEAVRVTSGVKAVLVVTSDKCYENREWAWGYRENDALGGHDPYSSSKACAELVTAAFRNSFLAQKGVAVASARAGNVIGGGDWAAERLMPDILRAVDSGQKLTIRSPNATRPWQHVLEPLSGYLNLAERLCVDGAPFAEGWNFGPPDHDAQAVHRIVEYVASSCPELAWECNVLPHSHEAGALKVDSSKAHARLAWTPRWDLRTALDHTLAWHRAWRAKQDMRDVTLQQIKVRLGFGVENIS